MRATSRWSVTFLVCSIGCSEGGTDIITPPPPPAAEFVLTFVPHPEESTTSAALGWQSAIPGISGTIVPADSSVPAKDFTASARGKVALSGLTAGAYIVEAAGWLTPTEGGRLGASDDAIGYAGRWTVQIAAGSGAATMETPASRRRGLVISEWAFNAHGYDYGGFLELFNNADTTVYLDGMIVAEGYHFSFDTSTIPCSASAPYRDDPQGIWARSFQRFPGSGREYPVAPGATIVVATDAIDHRPFEATGLDLSGADFESSGVADVDNPAATELIEVGLTVMGTGHGLQSFGIVHVPFIVEPIDLGTLQVATGPGGSSRWARFSADHILDAFAIGSNYAPLPDCPRLLNYAFDRQHFRERGTDEVVEFVHSVSRRRVPDQGGRVRLQWTRSGYSDFVRSTRTPGVPGAP